MAFAGLVGRKVCSRCNEQIESAIGIEISCGRALLVGEIAGDHLLSTFEKSIIVNKLTTARLAGGHV